MDARGGGRTAPRIWLLTAERDAMHPAAMGHVYARPSALGVVPGAWDAVSDLVIDGASPASPRFAAILGSDRADAFAAFHARWKALPDPAALLDGAAEPPDLDRALAVATGVGLVRVAASRRDGPGGPAALDALFGFALAWFDAGTAALVADLASGPHGLALDAALPSVGRYLSFQSQADDAAY